MIKCDECGKRIDTAGNAYRRNWCRKSYVDSRHVQWACPVCNEAAYVRSRQRLGPRKRFAIR
jgi:hypothetical protein